MSQNEKVSYWTAIILFSLLLLVGCGEFESAVTGKAMKKSLMTAGGEPYEGKSYIMLGAPGMCQSQSNIASEMRVDNDVNAFWQVRQNCLEVEPVAISADQVYFSRAFPSFLVFQDFVYFLQVELAGKSCKELQREYSYLIFTAQMGLVQLQREGYQKSVLDQLQDVIDRWQIERSQLPCPLRNDV